MNRYETIFIVDADVSADDQKVIFERAGSLIDAKHATLLMFDDWGVKKLAYDIKKKKQGHYVRLDYCGDGELVNEIERMFRHDYRILRFMTVNLGVNVDPEALKADIKNTNEKTVDDVKKPAATDGGQEEKTDENEPKTLSESPAEKPDENQVKAEASSGETKTMTDTGNKE